MTVDVFGDRIALRNAAAILKFEAGDNGIGVLGPERITAVFTAHDVNGDKLNLLRRAFFCQRDTDTGGVGEAFNVIDFHVDTVLSEFRYTPTYY